MSAEIKNAVARAALQLAGDSIRGELQSIGEELRGSPLAQMGGFALMRAKQLRAERPDGKLTDADLLSIIDELPAIVRAARAEQQDGGPDGTR